MGGDVVLEGVFLASTHGQRARWGGGGGVGGVVLCGGGGRAHRPGAGGRGGGGGGATSDDKERWMDTRAMFVGWDFRSTPPCLDEYS